MRGGERALPSGALRRRTFFGLFDASGWVWATVKALFWFGFIWVSMGYLPDRAYYFTVFRTIDIGGPLFVLPVVNFCPPENGTLPCPAPTGAVTAWQGSPAGLALPEPRSDASVLQSGVNLMIAGGRDAGGRPTATVFRSASEVGKTPAESGNLTPWVASTALPEPRADMAGVSYAGRLYLVGGVVADGSPTATVWSGTPDPQTGEVKVWEAAPELQLPAARTGAVAVAIPPGLLVLGGSDGTGPVDTVYFNEFDAATSKFKGWVAEPAALRLPQARRDATGYAVSGFVYIVSGTAPDGLATGSVFRLALDRKGYPLQWAQAGGVTTLPVPRTNAAGFTANGTLYVIGGDDDRGAVTGSVYWAIPDSRGDLKGGWHQLDETNLVHARSGAAVAALGSFAFLVGGTGPDADTGRTLERSNLAPAPPFFQLGMFGMTIPALAIEGEVGQQLGYLAAAGVDTGAFIALIVIGVAMTHRERTWELIERFSRGRIRRRRAY